MKHKFYKTEVCGFPGSKIGIKMEAAAACAKWSHEINDDFLYVNIKKLDIID